MNRYVRWQALACLGLFAVLTLVISPLSGPDSSNWVDAERARLERQLEHADPSSATAFKLNMKLDRLDALEAGRPQPGFPDEYLRVLADMKTPSDRQAPEYTPGYQIRELTQAKRRARAGVPLPWINRGPGNVAGRARAIVVDPSDTSGSTWFIASVGGGVWKTDDKGATWRELTDEIPVLAMQSLAMSPANTNVLYAGGGESYYNVDTLNGNGILKSTDNGETWTQLASTLNDHRFNNVSRIIVDPSNENIVLASATVGFYKTALETESNIFRSTDGGATWTAVHTEASAGGFSTPRILQLVADPSNFNNLYATAFGAGILKSTDAGLTWSYSNTGISDFTGRFEMAVSPVNGNYLFASAMGDDGGTAVSRLWHSIDGGANWVGGTETTASSSWLGGQGWYDNTIICHPTDPKIVYVGGVRLWKITVNTLGSAGYSIGLLSTGNVHVDNHGLQIVEPGGGGWFILNTNDGGVGVTSSGDTGWTAPTAGLTTTQFYGVDKRPGASAYAGGMQDNGTWISPVNSTQLDFWSFGIGGDGYETSWHFNDADKIIGGYQYNGFMRSLDGGVTWTGATSGLTATGGGNAPFITKIGKSTARPDHIFAVGSASPWISTDFGGSWSASTISSGTWGGLSSFHDIRVSKNDPDKVWSGSRMDATGDILVSTDGGLTFNATTDYTVATMGRISGLATDPHDANTAYVMFSYAERPKILKTTDLGATWTDISGFGAGTTSSNGFPDVAVYDLVVFPNDANKIWAGTEIGLVESLDGGANWTLADNGLPNVGIWFINIVEDEVIVGTHGRGVWSLTDPALETGLTFNPLLDKVVQGPGGDLRIDLNLRSVYDSTQVYVDGSLVHTYAANAARQAETFIQPVISAGTRSVYAIGYKGAVPYPSVTKTATVYVLSAPVSAYTNDFSAVGDFALDQWIYDTPAGFSSQALHSPHPYLNDDAPIALMTQPIKVAAATYLNFDEVCIIEPGDPGTVFGDFAFWDYAIVEGTTDGVNWVPVIDGYDAGDYSTWLSAYNTSSAGNASMYRTRIISLNNTFAKGDTVLLRFRIFADSYVTSWGWCIDNIVVDSGTPTGNEPAGRRFALEQNTPNPFNPMTTISFTTTQRGKVSLRVFDARGRLVNTLVDEVRDGGVHTVNWDGRDRRGAQASSGVYFYRVDAEGQVLQKKMTLLK